MATPRHLALVCLFASLAVVAQAQYSEPSPSPVPVPSASPSIPVSLEWTPPQLAYIGQSAEVKNSFVLDRTMLSAVSGLLPDSEAQARQSLRKLDGVAVHLYRFHDEAEIDPQVIQDLRQTYHAHGWQHLVSKGRSGDPMHTDATDLWLATDGITVKGGTLLFVTPRSVSLVTFAGNLNPVDLLRLRGHFGIPNFPGDSFHDAH
ncbi:hypothetical protein ACFPT7_14680 [Acidicapsa dinghuensis]|uniref:DUF4252 domain-containing protein n=1 Tax=Acidicapsa dinghuensis TaxID=2218256 RepID=A0ABW1EHW8_9BACT|nr:hypothetical protein [Acidicapsa dinghuensis]